MQDQDSPMVTVLRLGHRRERDKRITSHLGLTARAFGANKIVLSGEEDPSALETWESVTDRFGGTFESRYEPNPMSWLRGQSKSDKATVVHLTMYGDPWRECIAQIPRDREVVLVVGGTKVPAETYHIADYNVSIGNQPHSEVAALAVFLDAWVGPLNEKIRFQGGEIEVVPSSRGKVVINHEEE
ncbi:MAG: tRNA (cytidine(56)-2'-O)-methyltransferase [Candidatus Thermoplasmatota archaeon]|nr:tRNA (cytidine(56)-2'-O)-methyltransferase [Candidatus Thermoplasmatota archaeon]